MPELLRSESASRYAIGMTEAPIPYHEMSASQRVAYDVETGRVDEIGDFLLQYLADYGARVIDVQALARRVFERIEEEALARRVFERIEEEALARHVFERIEEEGR